MNRVLAETELEIVLQQSPEKKAIRSRQALKAKQGNSFQIT